MAPTPSTSRSLIFHLSDHLIWSIDFLPSIQTLTHKDHMLYLFIHSFIEVALEVSVVGIEMLLFCSALGYAAKSNMIHSNSHLFDCHMGYGLCQSPTTVYFSTFVYIVDFQITRKCFSTWLCYRFCLGGAGQFHF